MAPGTPAVSIICATFNRSSAIAGTIESVMAQREKDWELIVVSDGSTDDTDDCVRRFADGDTRVRLLRTDHEGHPAGPRNAGVAAAQADVIAYIDHDDRWLPGHLDTLLDLMDDETDLVATGCVYVTSDLVPVFATAPVHMCWHPETQLAGPTWEPSRVAHRRTPFTDTGGWTAGPGVEDWDLWVRMSDGGIRVRTTIERTVILLSDPATRRHRITRPHTVTLREFTTADTAQRALDRLHAFDDVESGEAAVRSDAIAWFERLVATPEFVTPQGWRGDVVDTIARHRHGPPAWKELVVREKARGFALVRPVPCQRAVHAERLDRLLCGIRPAQQGLVAHVIAD